MCLLLPMLCAAPAAAQDKLALRVNAKKGDQARFLTTTESEQAFGSQTVNREIALKVVDVNDKGELLVDVTIESIKGKGMGGEFDSTKKDEEEEAGQFGMMRKAATMLAGKTLRAKVSPDGTQVAVQDAKALVEELQKGMGMMGRNISEASLSKEIEGLFGRFPSAETAVGGTWQTSQTQRQMGFGLQMDLKHKLEKADAERALITHEGTIAKVEEKAESRPGKEEDESDPAAQMREMARSIQIENGKISGRSEVSRKDGMVMKTEIETSMEMSIGGQQIPVKSKSKIERVTGAKPADQGKKQEEPTKK